MACLKKVFNVGNLDNERAIINTKTNFMLFYERLFVVAAITFL